MIFKTNDIVKFVCSDCKIRVGKVVWLDESKNTLGVQTEDEPNTYAVCAEDAVLLYDAMRGIVGDCPTKDDVVNHPKHYCNKPDGIETIKIIDHMVLGLKPRAAVRVGNAAKYIDRHQTKNGKEDIKKAIWFLQDYVDHYEEFNME